MYVVCTSTHTHLCTCMCAGLGEGRTVPGEQSRHLAGIRQAYTTEGRLALNSKVAARELLEGATVSCSLGGLQCWGSLLPALGGQAPPLSGGTLSLSSCRRKRAKARHGTGWYGVYSLVFIGLVDSKGCLWILFPQNGHPF